MLSRIFNFTRKSLKVNPTPLGRWSRDGKEDIKAIYASHDHCGSQICKHTNEVMKEVRKVEKIQ